MMQVFKIPFNAGSLKDKESIDTAPDLIEKECENFYMNESNTLPVLDFKEIKVDNSNLDESRVAIEEAVSKIHGFSILLGGDHSITLPAFKGFARGKENPGLIVFDAHPDLMESFGTHEDYLRTLIEGKFLKAENVILVGTRNADKEEIKFVSENQIKNFSMKRMEKEGKEETCDMIMELAQKFSDLYVSIDIDVLDPAFAPGVSYGEPGGLTTRELLYFIHRLNLLKHFKMADIVEVNPKKDVNNMTVRAATKLLHELS